MWWDGNGLGEAGGAGDQEKGCLSPAVLSPVDWEDAVEVGFNLL